MKVFLTKTKILYGMSLIIGFIFFQILYMVSCSRWEVVNARSIEVEVYVTSITEKMSIHRGSTPKIEVLGSFINPIDNKLETDRHLSGVYSVNLKEGDPIKAYYDPRTELLYSGGLYNPYSVSGIEIVPAILGLIGVLVGGMQVLGDYKIIRQKNRGLVTVTKVIPVVENVVRLIGVDGEQEYISPEIYIKKEQQIEWIGKKLTVYKDVRDIKKYYVGLEVMSKLKRKWKMCVMIIVVYIAFSLNYFPPF